MGNRTKVLVGIFMFILSIFTKNAGARLGLPRELLEGNPYKAMVKKLHYKDPESFPWKVWSNKRNAPMFKKKGGKFIKTKDTADYLEAFWVERREGKYLQVIPCNNHRKLKGKRWMEIKDLIIYPHAIKNESTHVYFRVFPSFRISESAEKIRIDDLRFRDGPGEPGKDNSYHYLISKEEVPKNAAHFLYVYAVHFDDDDDSKYLDTKNFNKASYYLVGTDVRFSHRVRKTCIKGWLPRRGVILNFSRQFLEINPKRNYKWGHVFLTEPELKKFFDCEDKEEFIHANEARIIKDQLIFPPRSGQLMRWFILQQEPRSYNTKTLKVKYLRIGYPIRNEREDGDEEGLISLQDWSKRIQVFFLIDATTSMKPCIEAVRNIVTKFEKNVSKNIEFFSAIYRDDVDGAHRFEIWDRKGSLSSWLKNIRATDYAKDPTFEESLFYGIKMAVEQWKNISDFNMPAVRIMFIIGDTGNDDTEKCCSLKQIIYTLKKNIIFPHAIHFKHPVQHPGSPEGDAERKAMGKFEIDMKKIINGFYRKLQDENMCYSEVDTSEITSELENQINDIIITMQRFVEEIKNVRLGQETLTEGICKSLINKAEDIRECIKCKNTKDPLHCISKFCSKKGYNKKLFLPAYLEKLIEKNPSIRDIIPKVPQTGIGEGWVAIEVNGEKIYRPVLFLRETEIEEISNNLRYIISTEYKERQDYYKYFEKSVEAILGYLFRSIYPSEEELKGWLRTVIGIKIKNIDDLAGMLYYNENLRKRFEDKLMSIYNFIEEKLNKNTQDKEFKKERMYKDLENNIWWWIYPEEIIAVFENGKNR